MKFKQAIKTLLTSCLLCSVNVAADYERGLAAYNSGDYETASREWRRQASLGHADSQFRLANLHYKGEGVLQDCEEAVHWYTKAAEQGHAGAINNLGTMYRVGCGVPRDDVYAHMWYNIAGSMGDRMAASVRDFTAEDMTAAQLAEAQRLARECVKKNYKNC